MTSGGNNFNDFFSENQLTKFRGLDSIKANRDQALFCSKLIFLAGNSIGGQTGQCGIGLLVCRLSVVV